MSTSTPSLLPNGNLELTAIYEWSPLSMPKLLRAISCRDADVPRSLVVKIRADRKRRKLYLEERLRRIGVITMNDERFEITYTLTPRDYAAMTSAITRRSFGRNLFTFALLVASVWCLMVFFMKIYDPLEMMRRVAADSISASAFTALLIFVCAVTIANQWIVWGVSYLHYRKLASAGSTITITMDETGIQSRSSVASSVIPWNTVKRVLREKDHMISAISEREALILPRRSFKSEEDFNAAVVYALGRVSS
ncbi:hypothetical protein DSM25558_4183 [Agrobacterium sp. DSM 25558]|nr:hypothetical protein DSM25558_4183 [Agrobacterium sp. DSM 25558]